MIEEISNQIKLGKSFQDMAVLYRTNAQSRAIEEALIKTVFRTEFSAEALCQKRNKRHHFILKNYPNPKDWFHGRDHQCSTRGMGQKSADKLKMQIGI